MTDEVSTKGRLSELGQDFIGGVVSDMLQDTTLASDQVIISCQLLSEAWDGTGTGVSQKCFH